MWVKASHIIQFFAENHGIISPYYYRNELTKSKEKRRNRNTMNNLCKYKDLLALVQVQQQRISFPILVITTLLGVIDGS
jgi:hypothetical protein